MRGVERERENSTIDTFIENLKNGERKRERKRGNADKPSLIKAPRAP